ncbi:acetate kinase, putative [Aspergillus fumigatus A1163]|uniref:Probable acetate kinase n=2 Tax=Aspergillus fumigatus TaxID=746128 RepID=Q4WXU7_ASPFU|nr:acetate kinase, putative [Aspergillus fumigatus Af293]EAL92506.1 acetate kinase, putative [Aspergillus fumigatus Af293]EDP52672.1 acetate kinase, putative [Aspergillus fumigatus A1163]
MNRPLTSPGTTTADRRQHNGQTVFISGGPIMAENHPTRELAQYNIPVWPSAIIQVTLLLPYAFPNFPSLLSNMAHKTILSVNAGSSSVKITFYTLENPPKAIVNAQISGITAPPLKLKYTRGSEEHKEEVKDRLSTPQDAFKFLLQRCFSDPELSEVTSPEDLAYICHRVVHGGDYNESVVITNDTYHRLEELENLAPLHNYSALEIIRTCKQEIPNVKSVTFFDSAFHQTMPEHVKTYPIDQGIAKANGLRKYGFHGISYSFILRSVAEFLKKPVEETNIIAMHLGSGASMCAIRNGKSVDTTWKSKPREHKRDAYQQGGSFLSQPSRTKLMLIAIQAEEILNKQSGWKALTGTTDFSKIAVENPPSHAHKLAFDIVVDRILGFVGNYFVKLDGQVDAIVFAGGIGEKSALLRKVLVEKARCLRVAVDTAANETGPAEDQTVLDISKEAGKGPRVLVCKPSSLDLMFE